MPRPKSSFGEHTEQGDCKSCVACLGYEFKYPYIKTLDEAQMLRQDFLTAIRSGSKEDLDKISDCLDPYLYTIPMLRDQYCKDLLEEVEHYQEWCKTSEVHVSRPNTMNNYGVILSELGMRSLFQEFARRYLNPLARVYFTPFTEGHEVDDAYTFIVSYEMGKDTELNFHVDDSEVTANICLADDFEGGDLFFGGIRCNDCTQTPIASHEAMEMDHVQGCAIIHAGAHRHAAKPITNGSRHNLIVWGRVTSLRSDDGERLRYGDHPAWCPGEEIKQRMAVMQGEGGEGTKGHDHSHRDDGEGCSCQHD